MMIVGDGVADLAIGNGLDGGGKETHFAGGQLLNFNRLGCENTKRLHVEGAAIRHQTNALAFIQRSLNDARQHHHPAIGVEPRIEDERLQLIAGPPLGRRNALHHRFQHLGHAYAGLGADGQRMRSIQADGALDHLLGALDVGARQINLVDDGNDLQSIIDGDVSVGQGLRFHALRRIHHQQRAFARGQRARHFVAEVHVARRVDQVELIGLAVRRRIHHAHRMRLDGNAALPLQVHRVQHLCLHLARRQRAGQLEQTVGKRALPMINMGDDREVSDECWIHAR